MHAPVVVEGRPGPGLAGQVERGVLPDERKRDELGEAARAPLDRPNAADVCHPVGGRVDVPIHDRGGRTDPELVRGRDDLLPGVSRELALRQHPPDVVVQDLGRRPGDRPQPAGPALLEELAERDPQTRGTVHDLHRAERVDVDVGGARLDCLEDPEVEVTRQARVQPSLDAHLGRAVGPGLLGSVGDLVERERVALGVDLALRESTEAAARVTDVGEVDVAVDDVGDLLADPLPPKVVGDTAERLERVAIGLEERQRLFVAELRTPS